MWRRRTPAPAPAPHCCEHLLAEWFGCYGRVTPPLPMGTTSTTSSTPNRRREQLLAGWNNGWQKQPPRSHPQPYEPLLVGWIAGASSRGRGTGTRRYGRRMERKQDDAAGNDSGQRRQKQQGGEDRSGVDDASPIATPSPTFRGGGVFVFQF
jgi:hypothetical protein